VQLAKPKVDTSFVHSLDFDEKTGDRSSSPDAHAAGEPQDGARYSLTPDEARTLAAALSAWAATAP
jgi:hypothetical protein